MPSIEQHPLQIRQRPVQKAQSQKNTATVESQNTNLIARANSSSPKRAMETASVSHDEEHQHAVISFADGAKVRRKIGIITIFQSKSCYYNHFSGKNLILRQLLVDIPSSPN